MPRNSNFEVLNAFDEFPDPSSDGTTKCNKVRCKYCGFLRAKNTTRQIEHLQECRPYLDSPEGRAALSEAQMHFAAHAAHAANIGPSPTSTVQKRRTQGIWLGMKPNPAFASNRKLPPRKNAASPKPPPAARPTPAQPPRKTGPSLTTHLLTRDPGSFVDATQTPFLRAAGEASISPDALTHWLAQDSYVARAYINFIGALVRKVRLPVVENTQANVMYRTLDLLISALNNARREMGFFEITAAKYGIVVPFELMGPGTKSLLDLLVASSGEGASLLEGLTVLWALKYCYRCSWGYASTCVSGMAQPFLSFTAGAQQDSHTAALHQSLIPDWTSPAFTKFIEGCGALVDEHANMQTTGDGREEMMRCEAAFRQVVYLWGQSWPDISDPVVREDEEHEDELDESMDHGDENGGGEDDAEGDDEDDIVVLD